MHVRSLAWHGAGDSEGYVRLSTVDVLADSIMTVTILLLTAVLIQNMSLELSTCVQDLWRLLWPVDIPTALLEAGGSLTECVVAVLERRGLPIAGFLPKINVRAHRLPR